VATFDLGEETSSEEEALLVKGSGEHHIGPQGDGPAELAPADGRK